LSRKLLTFGVNKLYLQTLCLFEAVLDRLADGQINFILFGFGQSEDAKYNIVQIVYIVYKQLYDILYHFI